MLSYAVLVYYIIKSISTKAVIDCYLIIFVKNCYGKLIANPCFEKAL